jgi:hypothetical protein
MKPPPPTGWYVFGTHSGWTPPPPLEFSKRLDEGGMPLWERPAQACMADPCRLLGIEVIPGVVMCHRHRKTAYHKLCEIYHVERKKKERDQEIHWVAYNQAGERRPQMDLTKGSYFTSEVSGGLPTLGKDR